MHRKLHQYCRGAEHGTAAGSVTSQVDTVSVVIVLVRQVVSDFLLDVSSPLVGKIAVFLLAKC